MLCTWGNSTTNIDGINSIEQIVKKFVWIWVFFTLMWQFGLKFIQFGTSLFGKVSIVFCILPQIFVCDKRYVVLCCVVLLALAILSVFDWMSYSVNICLDVCFKWLCMRIQYPYEMLQMIPYICTVLQIRISKLKTKNSMTLCFGATIRSYWEEFTKSFPIGFDFSENINKTQNTLPGIEHRTSGIRHAYMYIGRVWWMNMNVYSGQIRTRFEFRWEVNL